MASIALGVVAQAPPEQAVVDRFIPYSALQLDEGDADSVEACYAVVERDAGGAPTAIAATYLGSGTGAMRMLVRNPNGAFEVGAQPSDNTYISGTTCEIAAVELDRQAPQELPVTLSRGKHDEVWVFKWANGVLANLTPTIGIGRLEATALSNPTLLDLDHNGRTQILTHDSLDDQGRPGVMYESVDGALRPRTDVRDAWFVLSQGVAYFEWNVSGAGQPVAYTLRLINGNADGTGRVFVQSVLVNGVEVMPAGGMAVNDEFKELSLGTGVPVGALVKVVASGVNRTSTLTAVLSEVPK